jgi:tetratricopeptide (TPR) repeat protein
MIFGLTVLGLISCSSAPKRPAEVFTVRNMAETQLELANQAADRGRYEEALDMLQEARRLAVSVDNPRLLILEGIARGNILYAQGYSGEAEAFWLNALGEAEAAGELELAGAVRIYMARSRLLAETAPAEAVRDQVRQEIAAMKTEKLYIAFGWIVIGLAERASGRWAEGEAAILQALAFHEKNNYLEKAAEDWYLIASIRSVSGQYDAALEALGKAIGFDRRSENSYGLGTDWRAMGDVYKKAGGEKDALTAYRRSIDIFSSIDLEREAADVESRLPK